MSDGVLDDDAAEQTITIGEYMDQIEAEELNADLILGGDEGKECTYGNGYLKRQALFSCLTCVPGGAAGVCTACSLACHDGHEVIELWTKRNFRCDCGNSKFGGVACKLYPEKDAENAENSYNHNFHGLYCTCQRPYPDPDAKEQVEMIQCCICEDWFHEEHLGLGSNEEVPVDEDDEALFDDLICQHCAVIFSFLKLYPSTICVSPKENAAQACASGLKISEGKTADIDKAESGSCQHVLDPSCAENGPDNCGADSAVAVSGDNNEEQQLDSKCLVGVDVNSLPVVLDDKMPMFLAKNWRNLLCRCLRCVDFYAKKGIAFLMDKEDTIEEYEKVAKQKREKKLQEQEGAEENFLNSLGHVQKIEILSGIADLKNEFQSFMESYDGSKPVTSEDVKALFENLARKKKQRVL